MAELELVGPKLELLFGLLVEGRGVGQPHKDGLRLLHIMVPAEVDLLHKGGHDDGLARPGGGLERDDLGRFGAVIAAQSFGRLHPQLRHGPLLEREQLVLHRLSLPVLILKLSR